MAQHFLLSAESRTLSLKGIYQAGEAAAYETFRKLRWPATKGAPVCPRCGCLDHYEISTRRKFKCAACHAQFSVTSCGRVTGSGRKYDRLGNFKNRLWIPQRKVYIWSRLTNEKPPPAKESGFRERSD